MQYSANTTSLSLLDCNEHLLATKIATCQEVMDIGDGVYG